MKTLLVTDTRTTDRYSFLAGYLLLEFEFKLDTQKS